MNKRPGNQFAFIHRINVNRDIYRSQEIGDPVVVPYAIGQGTVEFTAIAPATPEIMQFLSQRIHSNNPRLPLYTEEWTCLYCGSPQPLPRVSCQECGAPRSWMI